MAQGDVTLKKKIKPDHVKKTSSPAKVYHSRASKPSSVSALGALDALTPFSIGAAIPAEPTEAEIETAVQASLDEVKGQLDDLQAKMDAMLLALKK